MKKQYVIVFFVLLIPTYFYSMNNRLAIKNKSNWVIQLKYKKEVRQGGKNITRVIRSQETGYFGAIKNISNMKYQTYGKYYGFCDSGQHCIDLTEGKKYKSTRDTFIVISTCLQKFTTTYSYMDSYPAPEIPKSRDPWDLFTHAKWLTTNEQNREKDPRVQRYVLGLSENPSKDDIADSFGNLENEWSFVNIRDKNHPKLEANNRDFVNQALAIIRNTKKVLDDKNNS